MFESTVYWLTKEKYDIPNSGNWKNILFSCEKLHSSVDSVSDEIIADIKNKKLSGYVIITDCDNELDNRIIHRKFISNNIVKINSNYDKNFVANQIEWILSGFGTNRKNDSMKTFFISDTHFGHANICKYCNRPWNSGKDDNGDLIVTQTDVDRMDSDIIARWNSVVGQNDIVWHLGDFVLGKNQKERIPELVKKLNGRINLVLGNHDSHSVGFYYSAGFNKVYDKPVIINNFCILSHAPMEFVRAPFMNCYGHVHDCETYKTWSKDSCCVCVERHDYKPVSIELITQKWKELNDEA